jgi:hypothetical protein
LPALQKGSKPEGMRRLLGKGKETGIDQVGLQTE